MLSVDISWMRRRLEGVQAILSFAGWKDYPLFANKMVRKKIVTLSPMRTGSFNSSLCCYLHM